MKIKFLFLLLFLLQIAGLSAQVRTISGTVSDTDGEPLIGASVVVKGTTNGVITDIDGKFSLNANPTDVLVVSYIGYDSQEVTASGTNLRIVLGEADNQFDDVIVVAYGTVSRAGYTGSASTVKKEDIVKSQVSSVSKLLQGSASGVQSISSIGQPGADADIFIRGVGSINADSSPLYIVDGAPYDGALNSINPADIESINVLKDASATALYGSRAANGVIIITTKKGIKEQRARIDASFRYGVSKRAQKSYEHVNTNDYFMLTWEAMRNTEMYGNGKSANEAAEYATNNLASRLVVNPYGPNYPNPVGLDGKLVAGATPLWDDNWTELVEKGAHRSEAQVNIAGGGTNSTYYVSFGYLNETGIAPASDFERYTGRVNLNSDLTPWMRLTANIALNHSTQNAPRSQDAYTENALFGTNLIPSFYPYYVRDLNTGQLILDNNGKKQYEYGEGQSGYYRPGGASSGYNYGGSAEYDFKRNTRDIASIRTSLDIDLYKGLTYTGSINIDYNSLNYHEYYNPEVGPSSTDSPPGSVYRSNGRTTGFTGNNILTYRTQIDHLHNIKVMVGHEYYERNYTTIYGERAGFPALGLEEPAAASQLNSFSGYSTQYKLLSFFGNAEYNYNSKYFLSGSLRTDGSSRFHKDSRWGTFWSVGASWRIDEEDVIKSSDVISRLALRASYGGQGNDKVGDYAYQGLYSIRNNLGESGFRTYQLANYNLKWETNLNLNVGLDFGFFQNRLTGTFEFFNRQSKDLLFEIPRPASIGYSSYDANVGALRNRGFEIQLSGTPIRTRDWKWDIFANATHYKNKITEMPNEILTSYTIKREGGSVYDFFLVEWGGIDPADGLPQWYKTNADGTRELTKVYNDANNTESKIMAGTSLPDLLGGFGTTLTYRDFEVSALFAYSIGGKVYDRDKSYILNMSSAGRAMSAELLNRWTPENPYTDVPRAQTTTTNWTSVSTRFLSSASYMRMKNLSISYNIPSSVLKNIFLSNCRVYVQAENLFTIFGTEGLDPEQIISGLSYMRYPNMKTVSFGLQVGF